MVLHRTKLLESKAEVEEWTNTLKKNGVKMVFPVKVHFPNNGGIKYSLKYNCNKSHEGRKPGEPESEYCTCAEAFLDKVREMSN